MFIIHLLISLSPNTDRENHYFDAEIILIIPLIWRK